MHHRTGFSYAYYDKGIKGDKCFKKCVGMRAKPAYHNHKLVGAMRGIRGEKITEIKSRGRSI